MRPDRALLVLSLIIGLATACTRQELKDPADAMRQTSGRQIQDDLPLDELGRGLMKQIEWLDKTSLHGEMRFGPTIVSRSYYAEALRELVTFLGRSPDSAALQSYIDEHFDWYEVYGDDDWGEVKLTSYYLPRIDGSRRKTAEHSEAFLKRPDDLLQIMTSRFWQPVKDVGTLRGRLDPNDRRRIIPYYSREEIYSGILENRDLELIWADPIDIFVTQIQGSGTVRLANGELVRLGYDDQNGHPYVAIGKFLLDRIPLEKMSMTLIEEFLRTLDLAELRAFLAKKPELRVL